MLCVWMCSSFFKFDMFSETRPPVGPRNEKVCFLNFTLFSVFGCARFLKIRELFRDKTFCASMTSCPVPSKILSNFFPTTFYIIFSEFPPLVCIDVFNKLVLKLYFGFGFRSRSVLLLCLVWFGVVGCCCCRCCVVWFGVVCSLSGVVW
jgi:hypothetical protein